MDNSSNSLFISKLLQRANELENQVSLLSQKLAQVDSINYGSKNTSNNSSGIGTPESTLSARSWACSSNQQQRPKLDYVFSGDKSNVLTINKISQLPQGEVRSITLKNCNVNYGIFHQFMGQVGISLETLCLDNVNFTGSVCPHNLKCKLSKLEELRFIGFMSTEEDSLDEDNEIGQNNQKVLEIILKQKLTELKTLSLAKCIVDYELLKQLSTKLVSLELGNTYSGSLYTNNNNGTTLHSFLLNCQQLQNLSLSGEKLNLYCLPHATLKNLKVKDCHISGIPSGQFSLDLAHLDSCVIDGTIGSEVGLLVRAKGFLLRCDDALQGYNVLGSILQLDKRPSSFEINWIQLVSFFRERLLPDPKFQSIDKFLSDCGIEKSMDNFTLIKNENGWTRLIDSDNN